MEQFKIIVDPHSATLTLKGDLCGSEEDCRAIQQAFGGVSQSDIHSCIVQADEVTLMPEGVEMFVTLVYEYLMAHTLTYAPSHLNFILKYDPDYRHPSSIFGED